MWLYISLDFTFTANIRNCTVYFWTLYHADSDLVQLKYTVNILSSLFSECRTANIFVQWIQAKFSAPCGLVKIYTKPHTQ